MNYRFRGVIMLDYKNELRIRVCARKGTIEQPDLTSDPSCETPLDKEIIACAGKCIKGPKLTTFFWAYHCVNTWEDIQMNFYKHLNKELRIGTVQRYARDAANRILDRIVRG
jgi:hypothetical protein